jgi:hypothetical protein
MEYKISIILKFFVKKQYLNKIIKKLLKVNISNYNIIFWQDSLINSKYYDKSSYLKKYNECTTIIKDNLHLFKNAEFKQNTINLGTCKTCEVSMDYAFTKSEYAILLEDDVIPSNNFLKFFEYFIENKFLNFENKILFLASESIFFDAKNNIPTTKFIELCNEYVNKNNLNKYYIKLNFVPSSCFCTSKKIWEKVGYIRGQPNGDVDLCEYYKKNECKTIMPIVACCKDVGMLDKDGYSVTLHGVKGVSEVKNVYIVNDTETKIYELFPYNVDALYHLSSVKISENDTNLFSTIS